MGCFLLLNGIARHTRTCRFGIERMGIEMVRSPAGTCGSFSLRHPECLAELGSDKMLKLVNDKFLIVDNTFHQIADRDQSNSLFLLNDTQAFCQDSNSRPTTSRSYPIRPDRIFCQIYRSVMIKTEIAKNR
jgi:hypothetical protein